MIASLFGKPPAGTGKGAPALPSYFPKAWSAKPSVKNCQSIVAPARKGGWGGAAFADKTKGMAQLQEGKADDEEDDRRGVFPRPIGRDCSGPRYAGFSSLRACGRSVL